MGMQFVCRVVLVLIFIHVSSSQSTPCNLQIERDCVYESLDKFKIYRGMKCEDNKPQKLDFTSLCEGYCTLTINVCTDNKDLGVKLDITSLNVSISSSSSKLKEVVIITCNFSSVTDQNNCIQGLEKYSTTNIVPRTSDLIVSQTTQEVRTKQFISEIGFTLGNIIGAVVGGALFGTFTTAIIAVFMYRKSSIFPKSKPRSDELTNPVYLHDDVQLAETPNVTDRHSMVYNEVNDDMQNATMVSPKQQQTNYGETDVYNLLNESDNKEDKSEYYDHARPVPSLSVMEEGYGSLFVEQGDNENYSEVDGATNHLGFGNILGKNHQNNNYSTLEANE